MSSSIDARGSRKGPCWFPMALCGGLLTAVALLGSRVVVDIVAFGLQAVFLAYFLRHLAFTMSAVRSGPVDLTSPLQPGDDCPTVSVLVACHNEEAVVERLVESLLRLDYPCDRLQLIIVDDNSTDRTRALLAQLSFGHPMLRVVERASGSAAGKPAALNDALAGATGSVIVVFDADHAPSPDAVRRLARHFQDGGVAAVQGRCVIANPDDSLLARLVSIDYLSGYLVNEYGRQSLFALPAYGGANCAIRASALLELGGWNEHTVTEDTDVTMRLVLSGRRVRYDVTALDREEGVVMLRRYWRQRYRWARGHQQVWRDYQRAVWDSPWLSLAEKVEATMFLLAFHIPVLAAVGLAIVLSWSAGLAPPVPAIDLFVFWTLLFLGPLVELGGALMIAGADRRLARQLIFFLPLFFVSIALCTKAWGDAMVGRGYVWVKTARAGDRAGAAT